MGRRLPVVPAPEMNHRVIEAVALEKRPRLSTSRAEAGTIARELARDPRSRHMFLKDPGGYLTARGIKVGQGGPVTGEPIALTSEACTAVAICNLAWVLNVYAVENVAQAQKAINVQLAVNVEASYNYCITSTSSCFAAYHVPQVDGQSWV